MRSRPATALSCAPDEVAWIKAYNSSDGTYKRVEWQGGSRYFAGTGTDYVNTYRRSNSYVTVTSDSDSKSGYDFCVRDNVNLLLS